MKAPRNICLPLKYIQLQVPHSSVWFSGVVIPYLYCWPSWPNGVTLVCGMCSGADRATNLRQPEKSIPRGTLGAVVISFVIYLSYMGLWAAVATQKFLLEEPGGEVVKTVAYPLPILTQLAIIVASTAQAMQCLIISPRLLQVSVVVIIGTILSKSMWIHILWGSYGCRGLSEEFRDVLWRNERSLIKATEVLQSLFNINGYIIGSTWN